MARGTRRNKAVWQARMMQRYERALANGKTDVELDLTQGKTAWVSLEDAQRVIEAAIWCTVQDGRGRYYVTAAFREPGGKYRNRTLHRFVMECYDRNLLVDHIDGNGLNNRRENLRVCTIAENSQNTRKLPNTSSIFQGVSWDARREKWLVRIQANNQSKYLGYFENEVEAAMAYDRAAIDLHGDFASLNFPRDTYEEGDE